MTVPPEAENLVASVAGEMTAGAYLTVGRALELARAEGAAAERDRIIHLGKGDIQRGADIGQHAEEIHAEHHSGYIVPSLDSCPEHTRSEYEALAASLWGEPT